MGERVDEKRGRLSKRERDKDREKDEESMRIGGKEKSRTNRCAETACLQ